MGTGTHLFLWGHIYFFQDGELKELRESTVISSDKEGLTEHRNAEIEKVKEESLFTQSKDNPGAFYYQNGNTVAARTFTEIYETERPNNVPKVPSGQVTELRGNPKSNGLCGK
ncbi:MAG: hypothetical protein LBG27_09695 [Spirochaetaceae bacterium]|nr:hypothetical protein [Spirochaetaceae bacterium]